MKNIIILCVVLAMAVTGCKDDVKKADPIRPVRVFKINGDENPEIRTFPGKVKATREASLAFRVSGQITGFDVKEGDVVRQGQLIAQLDQRDFRAAVADLQAKLAGARSVLKEASLNIERNRTLLEEKIIAQSAFDTAQSNYETSRASVLSLEQSLRRARLNLQYTSLEAPFDGIIAVKQVDNHEYIQAKETIVQLEDISSVDVVVNVPESVWIRTYSSGRDGTSLGNVSASFESYPGKVFPLSLKEYQTKANPETQTYEVTMTMINQDGISIHPGMTAEVVGSVPKADESQAVSVPFTAVTGTPESNKYVWLLSDAGTVTKRDVTVGRISNDMFLVKDGLESGEIVVVAGVNYLREGQKVKVLEGRIGGRE